VTLVR